MSEFFWGENGSWRLLRSRVHLRIQLSKYNGVYMQVGNNIQEEKMKGGNVGRMKPLLCGSQDCEEEKESRLWVKIAVGRPQSESEFSKMKKESH